MAKKRVPSVPASSASRIERHSAALADRLGRRSLHKKESLKMNVEELRKICLAFAGATEQIQWGNDLLFKVGGKMFAVTALEPAPVWLSFKTTPELFAELTERPGIIPAPYLARAKWIALENRDAMTRQELGEWLRLSYDLVVEKLPRRVKESLSKPSVPVKKRKSPTRAAKKKRRK